MKEKLIGILHRLFGIYSPLGGENEISGYTANFLGCCGFKTEIDTQNNLLASRGRFGKLPLLHAHFENGLGERDMMHLSEIVYDREKDIFHMDGIHIGCNDKAGIGIILYLAMYSNLEFAALFTAWEKRRPTILDSEKEFFSEICWAFSLDGGGEKEFVTKFKNRETCDEQFADGIMSKAEKEGLLLREGQSRLDYGAYYISEKVPNTAMLPVGFYKACSRNDYLKVRETYSILKFVKNCMEDKNKLTVGNKNSFFPIHFETGYI